MLRARTPFARVRELLKVIGNDCRRGRAFFYRSLNPTIMSDIKQPFYKSKAFWTLISSIIAALSAFFLASCSAQAKVARAGVHIDTVRVDYIIRSNNFSLP
jgi:hypothetical protein